MFDVSANFDAFAEASDELSALVAFRPDLSAAAPDVVRAVQEGNRRARLAGLDKNGQPLAPLKGTSLKHREGSGEPLDPRGDGSRAVTNLVVIAEPFANSLRLNVAYHGAGFLLYHARGQSRGAPVRDILGIDPQTQAEVDALVSACADAQVREALAGRASGLRGFVSRLFRR